MIDVVRYAPTGIVFRLIVVGDCVCVCRAWILNLDSTVRSDGCQSNRVVCVDGVIAVLPDDNCLNTMRLGAVCIEPVLCFLVEAVIGERIGDAGRVGIGEGEVGRLCEAGSC